MKLPTLFTAWATLVIVIAPLESKAFAGEMPIPDVVLLNQEGDRVHVYQD